MQTVTANNLFLLTERQVEKNFFSGSTQKKDFLGNLLLALVTKLQSAKPETLLNILNSTSDLIAEKHILFAFQDQSLQSIFTSAEMSDSLADPREGSGNTLNDTLGINEANIGSNKVNFFITRHLQDDINIDKSGGVTGNITIHYNNSSPNDSWPGGNYSNYLRAILPKNAVLNSVSIDGKTQKLIPAVTDFLKYEKKNFTPPKGLEIDKYDEVNKTIYGMLLHIPYQASQAVSVNYSLSQKINLSNDEAHYNLSVIKQPGTENDDLKLSITFPGSLKISSNIFGATINNSQLIYDTNLDTDKQIQIDFAKSE